MPLLDELLEAATEFAFGEAADVVVAFAGVAGPGAGLPLDGEDVARQEAPVGKAGLVRKGEAGREEFVPGVLGNVRVKPMGGHGLVEFELALGDQPQNRFGGDRLGERGDVVERLRRDGTPGLRSP